MFDVFNEALSVLIKHSLYLNLQFNVFETNIKIFNITLILEVKKLSGHGKQH